MKNNIRKYIFTAGTFAMVSIPLVSTISCNKNDEYEINLTSEGMSFVEGHKKDILGGFFAPKIVKDPNRLFETPLEVPSNFVKGENQAYTAISKHTIFLDNNSNNVVVEPGTFEYQANSKEWIENQYIDFNKNISNDIHTAYTKYLTDKNIADSPYEKSNFINSLRVEYQVDKVNNLLNVNLYFYDGTDTDLYHWIENYFLNDNIGIKQVTPQAGDEPLGYQIFAGGGVFAFYNLDHQYHLNGNYEYNTIPNITEQDVYASHPELKPEAVPSPVRGGGFLGVSVTNQAEIDAAKTRNADKKVQVDAILQVENSKINAENAKNARNAENRYNQALNGAQVNSWGIDVNNPGKYRPYSESEHWMPTAYALTPDGEHNIFVDSKSRIDMDNNKFFVDFTFYRGGIPAFSRVQGLGIESVPHVIETEDHPFIDPVFKRSIELTGVFTPGSTSTPDMTIQFSDFKSAFTNIINFYYKANTLLPILFSIQPELEAPFDRISNIYNQLLVENIIKLPTQNGNQSLVITDNAFLEAVYNGMCVSQEISVENFIGAKDLSVMGLIIQIKNGDLSTNELTNLFSILINFYNAIPIMENYLDSLPN